MKNVEDLNKRIKQLRQENKQLSRHLFPRSFSEINKEKALKNALSVGKLVAIVMARSGGKNPFSKKGLVKLATSSIYYQASKFLRRKI